MKRLSVFTLLVIAAMLLTAYIPNAQAAGVRNSQVSSTGTPSASSTGQVFSFTEGGNVFIQLRALQNFKVNDVTGKQVGTVSDFVINPIKSRIDWLVTSLSNGNTVLLPWSSVSMVDANAQVFTFKDPAARLENAPVFNANQIDFNNLGWKDNTIAYWMRGFLNNQVAQGAGSVPATGGTPEATSMVAGTPEATSTVGSTLATPEATATSNSVQGTSVPATGGTTSNNGIGFYGFLASQLINQPVYSDVGQRSASVPTTGGTGSSTGSSSSSSSGTGSTSSSGTGSSSSTSATPEATSTTGSTLATPEATSTSGTGSTSSTASATTVPATGGNVSTGQQIGTVVGAIVTRINGNITYLLIAPSADMLGNTSGSTSGASSAATPEATTAPSMTLATPSATMSSSTTLATPEATTSSSTTLATPESTSTVGSTLATPESTLTMGTTTMATPESTSVPATGGTTTSQGSTNNFNGQQVVAVPFRSVTRVMQNGRLVLAVSPYLLSRAPFISNNLPDQLGFNWDNSNYNFWASNGQQFARSGATGITVTGGSGSTNPQGTSVPSTGGTSSQPSSSTGTNQASVFLTLKSMMNNSFKVVDQNGNTIGTASDYVINVPKSRIDWIVMSANNGRTVLVPWSSLSAVTANQFVFKDAGSRLENAPDFNANAMNFNNLDWDQNTIGYWMGGGTGSQVAQGSQGVPATGGNASATPMATSTAGGTAVPATGSTSNQGSSAGVGTYAVLASQLVNLPVYVEGSTTSVPTTGGTGSSSGTGSTSSTMSATPEATMEATTVATSSAGVSTMSTSTASSSSSSSTASGTAVPTTGGTVSSQTGEQIGTVVGAVVTRINGDIRYLLVQVNDNVVVGNLNSSSSGTGSTSSSTSGSAAATPEATGTSSSSSTGTTGSSTSATPEATSTSGSTGTSGTTGSTSSTSSTTSAQGTSVPAPGGTGNRVIAVPMSMVILRNGQLFLTVPASFLRNAPTYDAGTFPDTLNFGWDTSNLNFWSGNSTNQSSSSSSSSSPTTTP